MHGPISHSQFEIRTFYISLKFKFSFNKWLALVKKKRKTHTHTFAKQLMVGLQASVVVAIHTSRATLFSFSIVRM